MNIFKSLSQGNGSISETNITSFLSYLLNSTNELDNSFIVLFLELIDKNLYSETVKKIFHFKQTTLRERVTLFSKEFSVTAIPEFSVQAESSKQIVDVFLKISYKHKMDEADVAYILIENKIKTGSINKFQLAKQYDHFKKSEEYMRSDIPVFSLLLTSDFETFVSMYDIGKGTNPETIWLKWTNKSDNENSIEAILKKLLILESQAEIQPINPNTQFILKSFIDYIVTEFSNVSTGQRNYSFNGSEVVEFANVKVEDKKYILRRYDNKMIRVFDENDNLMDIEVRPLLRKINVHYNLKIDTKHSTGTNKNSQVFGREIITEFNKLESH